MSTLSTVLILGAVGIGLLVFWPQITGFISGVTGAIQYRTTGQVPESFINSMNQIKEAQRKLDAQKKANYTYRYY